MQSDKLTWLVKQDDKRTALQLKGELVRDTLLPLWNQYQSKQQDFSHLLNKSADFLIDLTHISRIDSAGFALLFDILQSHQEQTKANISLQNPPSQLLTLADLFGLDNWIKSFL